MKQPRWILDIEFFSPTNSSEDPKKLIQAHSTPRDEIEVYNYSGTDARAFPAAGVSSPVRAWLIPTENNHHPQEKAALSDIDQAIAGIKLMCQDFYSKL